MNVAERWSKTWTHCEVAPPAGTLDRLAAAYSEPHRAYHTLQHLSECFAHLDASPLQPEDPAAVELALWFHDARYDTRSTQNEEESAAWALEALAELERPRLHRIEGLILVTKHDAEPEDDDQALLLDIDLSILGAPASRFDEYERQVRREYEWVPEPAYRTARARIVTDFASRPQLFRTPHFRAQLEAQAKSNLQRSLATLGA